MERVQNAENDERPLSRAEKLAIYQSSKALKKVSSAPSTAANAHRQLPAKTGDARQKTRSASYIQSTISVKSTLPGNTLSVRDINLPSVASNLAPSLALHNDGKSKPATNVKQLMEFNAELQRQLASSHDVNRLLRAHNDDLVRERDGLIVELKSSQELIDDCKAALLEMQAIETERDQLQVELQEKRNALEDMEAAVVGCQAKVLMLADEKAILNEKILLRSFESTQRQQERSINSVHNVSVSTEGDMDDMLRSAETMIREAQAAVRDFNMMRCANEVMKQEMDRNKSTYRSELRDLEARNIRLKRSLEEESTKWRQLLTNSLTNLRTQLEQGLITSVAKYKEMQSKYEGEKRQNDSLRRLVLDRYTYEQGRLRSRIPKSTDTVMSDITPTSTLPSGESSTANNNINNHELLEAEQRQRLRQMLWDDKFMDDTASRRHSAGPEF